jgi:hypothetical protein
MKKKNLGMLLLLAGFSLAIPACDSSPTLQSSSQAVNDSHCSRLVGEWIDVDDADEFVNISQVGDSWIWEDGSGQRPAKRVGDHLEIDVGLGYTGTAYWDDDQDTLMMVFAGKETVYREK